MSFTDSGSLQGWLSYLKSGKHVYMDCTEDDRNEKELIEEIKIYYKIIP